MDPRRAMVRGGLRRRHLGGRSAPDGGRQERADVGVLGRSGPLFPRYTSEGSFAMKRLAGEAGIIVIYVLLAVVSGALIYVGLQDMQSDAAQQDRFLAGILCAVFSVGMLPVALALANPRRGGGRGGGRAVGE